MNLRCVQEKLRKWFTLLFSIILLEFVFAVTYFNPSNILDFLQSKDGMPGSKFIIHIPNAETRNQSFIVNNYMLFHQLVSPKHKLQWCFLYKVASSQITALFHRLEDDPDWLQLSNLKFKRSESGCNWLKQKRKLEWRFAYDGEAKCHGIPNSLIGLHMLQPIEWYANSVVMNPAFRKVLLVRDPVDRLISGILDKCGHGSDICPIDTTEAYRHEPLKSYLAEGKKDEITKYFIRQSLRKFRKLQVDYGERWGERVDKHFRPQALFCNIQEGMPFNYIVKYDNARMGSIMDALFEELNLPKDLLHGWGMNGDAPLFENRVHGHVNQTHATLKDGKMMERVNRLIDPDMLKVIHDLYKMDYDIHPDLNFI